MTAERPRLLRLEDVFTPAECERIRAHIAREVAAAPPPTEEQLRLIRRLAPSPLRSTA